MNILRKFQENPNSVFLSPCIEVELLKIIDSLPNKNSAGHDGISNVLVKNLKAEIIISLTIIFNNSLSAGIFPELMKHAEVVPLYKSGIKLETTNYRPISLLLTISKILEQFVYKEIYTFLNDGQLFESQYGLRTKPQLPRCHNRINLSNY